MAVSTQQLAEELQIFGMEFEDSLMEKRESRTEGDRFQVPYAPGVPLGS